MRTVRFVMTGPPTADAGSFVGIVDDDGNPVSVGWWEHDGTNWCYRMPVRMVPELIVPNAEIAERPEPAERSIERAFGMKEGVLSEAQRKRRELKERIKAAPKKETPTMADQAGWEKCPSCEEMFNPQTDELMDCGRCSEPKCTRKCLPNPVEPCLDCRALVPDESDGAYSAPPASAVFGGKQINDPETFRRLGATAIEAADEDDEGGD